MAAAEPYLRLVKSESSKIFELFWREQSVGVTQDWSELKKIAPKHIFSIGSGPSIKEQDLTNLEGHQCVLVNGAIQLVIDGVLSNPLAVMVEDGRYVLERAEQLMSLPKGTRLCLTISALYALGSVTNGQGFSHFKLYFIDGFKTQYGEDRRALTSVSPKFYRHSKNAALSLEMPEGHFGCGTVMYSGIQLAFYLKAKALYLVGFDLTNFNQPRFYETKNDQAWTGLGNAYENRILPAMQLMMEAAEESGMTVYNCSHKSIIPRELIPFDGRLMPK